MSVVGKRSEAVPVYYELMRALDLRLQEIGVSMERLSDTAGIPDRCYAKLLNPESPAGRVARWSTVQFLLDTLCPDGFSIELTPKAGPRLDAIKLKHQLASARATYDPVARRKRMQELGRLGGRARAERLRADDRSEIARKAARTRWKGAT